MKLFLLSFLVVVVLGVLGLRLPSWLEGSRPAVRRISATEARQIMSGRAKFVLLDVRTEEEFKERRINGALLIPYDEIPARAQELPQDKKKTILVYCRLGRRSEVAGKKLNGLGYVNVYDLGGVVHWPYETVTD